MNQSRIVDFARSVGMSPEAWADAPTITLPDWRHKVMELRAPGGVIFRSSGTTGIGAELAYSRSVTEGAVRRALEFLRLTPLVSGMRVAVCFGYGCFPPSDFYQRAVVNEACDVLPLGSGRNLPTEFKCGWMSRMPPDGILGMPSYLFRIGRVLDRQGLLEPVQRHCRFLVTGGEPLGVARKEALEALFRAQVFDHYGLLEAPMVAGSCQLMRMHVSMEYACEVLTSTGIKATGQGELLLSSSFAWPGLSLVRLHTGDEVVLAGDPCGCGREGPVIEVLGRINNERKVKGVRLSMPELHRCLMEVPVIDYYLEVVRDWNGNELATLHVETDVAEATIRERVSRLSPVKFDVNVVEGLQAPLGATGKPLRYVERTIERFEP